VNDVVAEYKGNIVQLPTQDLFLLAWRYGWMAKARPEQVPPDGEWNIYGAKSGRGWGKTLAGANWIGLCAAGDPNSFNFVVAPTYEDVRYTCFDGPTGLFNTIPKELIDKVDLGLPSITLWNGALIRGFSADTPERLRGPQCGRAWCDEIASWRYPDKALDNLIFGLRLGTQPRIFWTGTPKPTPFMRKLVKMPKSIVVSGSTYENRANLAPIFFDNVAKYEGTNIGRQELYGEVLDPEEAGIVKRSQWRLWPHDKKLPKYSMIILSLDTAFTEENFDKKEQTTDPSAGSVWGVFEWEKKKNAMLLDAWEERLGFPALIKRVKDETQKTYGDADEPLMKLDLPLLQRPKHTGRKVDIILIEDKGSGISLRQSLAAEDILTWPYNPGMADKLTRLHLISPAFAHDRIWAVESAKNPGTPRSWADPLITQVCTFIGEGSLEHDDLLDTCTQAIKLIMDKFGMTFTPKAPPDPEQVAVALAAKEKREKRGNPYAS